MRPHTVDKVYYAHLTPLAFLERSAYVYPDKPAIVYGDRKITYAQVQERCWRVASALRKNGLQTGDRVAILSPNVVPMAEAHFFTISATAAPVRARSLTRPCLSIGRKMGPAVIDAASSHAFNDRTGQVDGVLPNGMPIFLPAAS